MHYLDDVCGSQNPDAEETRNEVKARGQDKFPHVDFGGSLDDAFSTWDAVSAINARGMRTGQLTLIIGI